MNLTQKSAGGDEDTVDPNITNEFLTQEKASSLSFFRKKSLTTDLREDRSLAHASSDDLHSEHTNLSRPASDDIGTLLFGSALGKSGDFEAMHKAAGGSTPSLVLRNFTRDNQDHILESTMSGISQASTISTSAFPNTDLQNHSEAVEKENEEVLKQISDFEDGFALLLIRVKESIQSSKVYI